MTLAFLNTCRVWLLARLLVAMIRRNDVCQRAAPGKPRGAPTGRGQLILRIYHFCGPGEFLAMRTSGGWRGPGAGGGFEGMQARDAAIALASLQVYASIDVVHA